MMKKKKDYSISHEIRTKNKLEKWRRDFEEAYMLSQPLSNKTITPL